MTQYRKCEAQWCKNFKKEGLTFHRFPKDDRSIKWVEFSKNAKLKNMSPERLHSNNFLCAEHFTDRSFMNPKNRSRLIKSAVPTIIETASSTSIISPKVENDNVLQEFPLRKHTQNYDPKDNGNMETDVISMINHFMPRKETIEHSNIPVPDYSEDSVHHLYANTAMILYKENNNLTETISSLKKDKAELIKKLEESNSTLNHLKTALARVLTTEQISELMNERIE